jgi:hypothetical protein
MAVTLLSYGHIPEKGINYTAITDSSADWSSPTLPNNTYFYDKTDKLPHYKDASGNILEVFTSASGNVSGYTLTLGHASNTMLRNTTWNIGGLTYLTPSATNVGSRRIAVPKSGVVKKVSIMTNVNGVSSSASPSPTIQLFNNTTSTATTITGTNLYSGTAPFTTHNVYTISAAVTEGDEINVQAIIANVVTEPTQVVMLIQLWIEEI